MAENVLWKSVFEGGTNVIALKSLGSLQQPFWPLFIARKYKILLLRIVLFITGGTQSREKYDYRSRSQKISYYFDQDA